MKRILRLTLFAVLAAALSAAAFVRAEEADTRAELVYFHSPGCHRCIATRANIMPLIEDHFRKEVRVAYRDISEVENYKMLFALKRDLQADERSVFPVLYFGGKFLDGRDDVNLTYSHIAAFIQSSLGKAAVKVKAATDAEIVTYFREMRLVAIAVAGFVDGINPCAFTVIVFFISFLFFHNYRRRNIAIIGMAFMTSVFITYVMIGLGLFGWLRAMEGFRFVTGVVNIGIALLAISLGAISLYDAVIFRRKGQSDGMVLQLPKYLKNRIHAIIGNQYRVKKEGGGQDAGALTLFMSALAVGFLVSIFESVCTGQMYLPTIMYIFKTTEHKLPAFGCLVFYNVMFMLPLVAVYLLAMAGVTSERFSMALKNNMFLIKLFMAGLFFFLGISLLYAADGAAAAGITPAMAKQAAQNDPNFHDFGTAKEGDILKHTFMFANKEAETVNITEVNASCSCTSSKVDVKTIAPGQTVPIELTFDTKGYPGIRKRQLFVHTDSKTNPLVIFEVQAEVVPK